MENLTVRDILQKTGQLDPLGMRGTAQGGEKINAVIEKMSRLDIGAIVVLDNEERICGIVTERDIVRKGFLKNIKIKKSTVAEIMTHNVICAKPEDNIKKCVELILNYQIRHIPICDDNNKLIGVLSIKDLFAEFIT